jgi:hypothetical protein
MCAALLAIQEIRFHRSFPFDVDRSSRLEPKRVAQRIARRGGNVARDGTTISDAPAVT